MNLETDTFERYLAKKQLDEDMDKMIEHFDSVEINELDELIDEYHERFRKFIYKHWGIDVKELT